MKIRILLFLFFAAHAVLALFWPGPGRDILADVRRGDELRRKGNVRVGDKT